MSCPVNPLVEECKRLRKAVRPISERYHGLTEQINSKNTMYPFVLLLGNHSSGKSSFINHILKRKVQMTGVAPTDDNFTIIGPGETDIDRNGPALIGDPDLGFSGLKAFGPVLVNHTQLKVRSNITIKDFMIVDSPGMIDSPVTDKTVNVGPVGIDRGYNFEGVIRWYAERSDVILLFFDPDKPGTTGETLSILTTALVGLDHKLYIILNKADQFLRIHDFARAYGSLCWNLSKVIPRKDLPRIHTMCLPVVSRPSSASPTAMLPLTEAQAASMVGTSTSAVHSPHAPAPHPASSTGSGATLPNAPSAQAKAKAGKFISVSSAEKEALPPPKTFFEQGIHDLEESRAEIEMETFNAPRRRVDNEITRLTENVNGLLMHCRILDKVLEAYHNRIWRARALTAATFLGSVALTVGVNYLCDWLLSSPETAPGAITATADSAPAPAAAPAPAPVPAATVAKTSASGSKATGGSPSLRGTAANAAKAAAEAAAAAAQAAAQAAAPTTAVVPPPALPVTPSIFEPLWDWSRKRTYIGWSAVAGVIVNIGVITAQNLSINALLETFNQRATYETIYQQLYQDEITANNESTLALGKVVLESIAASVNGELIRTLPRVEKTEFTALHRILNEDIPNLRRRASPDFPVLSPMRLSLSLPQNLRNEPLEEDDDDESYSDAGLPPTQLTASAEALERVPYKTHRAAHAGLHVHFSPSTNSSPITTRDRADKKRQLLQHFGEAATTTVTPEDVQAYLAAHPAQGSEEDDCRGSPSRDQYAVLPLEGSLLHHGAEGGLLGGGEGDQAEASPVVADDNGEQGQSEDGTAANVGVANLGPSDDLER